MTREWTRAEEQLACRLAWCGTSRQEIAARLGRPETSVSCKLWKLGIESKQRRKGELTEAVAAMLRKRVKYKGRTRRLFDWEIALELKVERAVVQKVRRKLGVPSARARLGFSYRARIGRSGVTPRPGTATGWESC